jgi:hypothetical protein
MKLIDHFNSFITTKVNLDQRRLDQLEQRVTAINAAFKADGVFRAMYLGYIPQGSWAHRTIIRPQSGDEFDGDFLLQVAPQAGWVPQEYLRQARAALRRSSGYSDKVQKKNRCVRIVYANDCHVDAVPYLALPDGRQVIIDYASNEFEDTNPEGFTDWMREKDELAKGNLRRVIRLAKYLRDSKNTFSCPSVILTTLLAERVQVFDGASRYGDLASAFAYLMVDLKTWTQAYVTMPSVTDPSCPGTTFNHRWDEAQYRRFRDMIALYADLALAALNEPDKATSIALWRKVFGPDFATLPVSATSSLKGAEPLAAERAPEEEFIEALGFPRVGGRLAQIHADVEPKPGFRSGDLRRLRHVQKGRQLKFRLETDVSEPYDLYWKVRNTGREAAVAQDLRGRLIPDQARSRIHREHTKYSGRHYVEAYVVKGGRVIATDHHDVVID